MKARSLSPNFATLVHEFFCDRLMQQQNVSPQTIASYRDTFCLLLDYLQRVRRKQPDNVTLADLDAPVITAFLEHLEKKRQNSIRTRNVRFSAIRSFLKFAAARDPISLPIIQRVLAIPLKRFSNPAIHYLSREEVAAILDAPDTSTWSGHRDRILFTLLYNTGARVSEIITLRRADLRLGSSMYVQLTGKGRKLRIVPLWKSTTKQLREWLKHVALSPEAPVFPNRDGHPMSRSGVEKRLRAAVQAAAETCPSLRSQPVSPHTFRHTTAMHMLQAGVDFAVIAMWLGHESIETTHQYVEANLAMKELALSKVEAVPLKQVRYRPDAKLLQFLNDL